VSRDSRRPLLAVVFAIALAATTLAAPGPQADAVAQLPGDQGPRFEIIGTPPHGNEVVDLFVYERPDQAAQGAVRPRRFPARTRRLKFDLRLKEMPRTGVRVHFEVLSQGGPLATADGLVTMARLATLGVASLEFDLIPKSGVFADGPYQLRLFMNDAPVAVLNWSVGAP
jgi:hypothetical protein